MDLNDKLGALLRELEGRRAPDCSWLFPSPQRDPCNEHARTFRESLKLARKKAGLTWMGFHDLRHFFPSFCVMCRIDFMTISEWLGHKDGGKQPKGGAFARRAVPASAGNSAVVTIWKSVMAFLTADERLPRRRRHAP